MRSERNPDDWTRVCSMASQIETGPEFLGSRSMEGRTSTAGVLVLCFLVTLCSVIETRAAHALSRLDIEDGAGLPGEGHFLCITLSEATGLSSLSFSLTYDPAIIQNARIFRGGDTTGWATWDVKGEPGELLVVGTTTLNPVDTANADVALFIFDVSPFAGEGTEAPLILDDAKGSIGFEIRSDYGVFVVGNSSPKPTERLLEFEISPSDVFPGDQAELRLWLSHTPKLSNLQVFLQFPEGAFAQFGEIGGLLVENLGWDGHFVPEQPTAPPSILITTFNTGGATQPVPSGRTLVASVPIRIGKDWGGNWRSFSIEVSGTFIVGDISQGRPNYHARTNDLALFQKPPDFNQDGSVNDLDLFIMQDRWKGPGLP